MASLGIQVHGGMGYVEETGAAQHLRDSRIAPIYEGTNGIQAIDLVTRKLPMESGDVVRTLISEMRKTNVDMEAHSELNSFASELSAAIDTLSETSEWLLSSLSEKSIDEALAGATPYLRQLSTVIAGWLMARQAIAVLSGSESTSEFGADKVTTARFFGEHLLPQVNGLTKTITAGASLLDEAVL